MTTPKYTNKNWNPLLEPDTPAQWHKPRMVRVSTDLFSPEITKQELRGTWVTMHHTHKENGDIFQLLTDYPERIPKALGLDGIGWYTVELPVPCPEPGIWLGVECSNQHLADERIPSLLQAPASVRFVRCKPSLGAIQLGVSIRKYSGGIYLIEENR